MFQNNNGAIVKRLASNSFQANHRRNIFIILTLALTAFMITSFFSIGDSYIKTCELQQIRIIGTNVHVALTNPEENQINILKTQLSDIVTDVGISHRLGSIENTGDSKALLGLGWVDDTEWEKHRLPTISKVVGKYPSKENEIMIPEWALEELGIQNPKVGMTISLSYRLSSSKVVQKKDFRLSGYFHDYTQVRADHKGSVYVSKEFHDEAGIPLTNGGAAMLRFNDSENVSEQCKNIEQELSLSEGQSLQIVPIYQNSSSSIYMLISMLVLIVCVCGYLLIYNVLYISVSKDIRFYGLLKTIGTTKRQIKRMVQWQVLKLCGIGSVCGLLLGAITSFWIIPMALKSMLPKATDMGIHISFAPTIFIGAAAISFVTAWIGSMKPARKAGSISPIEAVRYTEVDHIRKKINKSRNGGKPIIMALRNVFRNKKSAVITFASLVFGMTIFLLTTGLLTSLSAENFVKDWGESDFVVTYDLENIGKKLITSSIVDQIKKIKDVQDVRITTVFPSETEVVYDPEVFSDYILSFANNPEVMSNTDFSDPEVRERYTKNFFGFIYGIDTDYVKELNQKLETPIDLDQFESGKLVLLSEVLDQDGSSVFTPGKKIQIKNPVNGKLVSYQIAPGFLASGFQSTRGSSRGTAPNLYISQSAMKQLIEEPEIYRVSMNSKAEKDAEILSELKSMIPQNDNLIILSRYEKIQEIRGYLLTTKILGIGLSAILFLIGIMNFVNTIYVSVTVRGKELAVLESVGMRKKQVRSMLAYEGLIYAIITLLLTTVIGTGLLNISFPLLKSTASYAKYSYPIISMVMISVITLFICIIIPLIAYKATERQSIVHRLRSTQG